MADEILTIDGHKLDDVEDISKKKGTPLITDVILVVELKEDGKTLSKAKYYSVDDLIKSLGSDVTAIKNDITSLKTSIDQAVAAFNTKIDEDNEDWDNKVLSDNAAWDQKVASDNSDWDAKVLEDNTSFDEKYEAAEEVLSNIQGQTTAFSAVIGDGTSKVFTVQHSLNTTYYMYRFIWLGNDDGYVPEWLIEDIDANNVKITFENAIPANGIRLLMFSANNVEIPSVGADAIIGQITPEKISTTAHISSQDALSILGGGTYSGTGIMFGADVLATLRDWVGQQINAAVGVGDGTAPAPDATSAVKGILKLFDTINGTATDGAPSQAAVKAAFDQCLKSEELDSKLDEYMNINYPAITADQIQQWYEDDMAARTQENSDNQEDE